MAKTKTLAFSSFLDRVVGAKHIFESIDKGEISVDEPLIEGNQYIFQNHPDKSLKEQLLSEGKEVLVDAERVNQFFKTFYVQHHATSTWKYYTITQNPYFLYDIICLHNYADIAIPDHIKEESLKLFSELADIAINSDDKQKDAAVLLGFRSPSKGTNTLWAQYINFLSDLVIHDVVEQVIRDENPSSRKYLYGQAKEIIDKTVTESSFDVGSIIAKSSSISDIKRIHARMSEQLKTHSD